MSQKSAMEFVGKYKAQIAQGIQSEFASRLKEVQEISPHLVPVVQAMQELSVGGKRLRGILVILGYQMGEGTEVVSEGVIQAAVAMELFHLGLLIQDDWMDQDDLRRGVVALHKRYDDPRVGNAVAMLAGDYTFGWTTEIITNLKFSNSQIVSAMRVWGKYFTRVGYGQTLDGLDIADDTTILKVLSIKSGEYSCVLPLLLGATLGDATPSLLARLEHYGMELGLVFQLRDDWIGMYGDTQKTGKPVGKQAEKDKKTFATMYGREKTETAIQQHWDQGRQFAADDPILLGLLEWVATRES